MNENRQIGKNKLARHPGNSHTTAQFAHLGAGMEAR
jgi:hypothetical protein